MYIFAIGMKEKYSVIGLMSGTSLDGLDIAYCEFEKGKQWSYKILSAKTISYSSQWKNKLRSAYDKSRGEVKKMDKEYGVFIAKEVLAFIKKHNISPSFIASHGHTVFHQPEKKITVQIGSGKVIAEKCNLPVVYDFRKGDVLLGGQGAPLVPLVDRVLFHPYTFCLNLGGFANISFDDRRGSRMAFDICPVNMVMNRLAELFGKEFDRGGKIAKRGKLNGRLLQALNQLHYYKAKPPKSLGREWVEKKFMPILNSFTIPVEDKMRTVCEHVAIQIANSVDGRVSTFKNEVFITGGGAYNDFLIARMKAMVKAKIILADNETIQFKEAMAFAFLGVLRMRNEVNILKSVTGAKQDSSGGKIVGWIKNGRPHKNH
jgi:anhydro-N-acetylmuramic acid kinase